MEEIGIRDAARNSQANSESRWPSREPSNRLEPCCWPALRPTFKLKPGARVFTIGSCFARNIERYLYGLGFDIPTVTFVALNREAIPNGDMGVLNRYTPPAIYQELKWVRDILDRDDQVRMEDVEPFFLDVGRGLVYDLGRLPFHEFGTTPENALHQRRLLYRLFKFAFDCDAMVITLGFIECWWDRERQAYVEFNRNLLKHPNRFAFRRLDYPTALDYVQRAVDLVKRDRPVPILLTTSPVPLARTFTADDVIVANTYSKSVLRAVAEVIRTSNEAVDYFPSYESVMLSRDGSVWMDDLIHVQPAFVSSIMLRVAESYVDLDVGPAKVASAMLEFVRRVTQEMWSEAKETYDRIDLKAAPRSHTEFYVCAAELMSRLGNKAAVESLSARAGMQIMADYHLRIAKALESVGDTEEGAARRAAALASVKGVSTSLWNWFVLMKMSNRTDDLDWLFRNAERLVDSAADLCTLAQIGQQHGRLEVAEHLYRKALRLDAKHADAGIRLAYLLFETNRRAEGLAVLEDVAANGCDNPYLHPLVSDYRKRKRHADAKALMDRLIKASPNHAGLQELAASFH